MMNSMRLILFGPPGAGKGTQAIYLRDYLNVPHISSGDLFRSHLQERTPLGLRAAEYINSGQLVPDDITIDIILDKILDIPRSIGFLLDGFPRTELQAQILSDHLNTHDKNIDKVIYINVPTSELIRRLSNRYICRKCQAPQQSSNEFNCETNRCPFCDGELYQRTDDSEESVTTRINVYQQETMPVLDYYRSQDLVMTIDGLGTVKSVTGRVKKELDNFLTKSNSKA